MEKTKVEAVVHALADEILGGRRSNELFLESEHFLMHRFKCSRHTVREACERLIGSGLIFKRAGEGLWLRDPGTWPLDRFADEILALRDTAWSLTLLKDLLGHHRAAMAEVAQLAAERCGDGELAELEAGLAMLQRALGYKDDHLIAREEGELLQRFVETARSRAFRLSLNAFHRVYARLEVRRPTGTSWCSPLAWRSLIDVLRRHSGAVARALVAEMVRPMHDAVQRSFSARLPHIGPAGETAAQGGGSPAL